MKITKVLTIFFIILFSFYSCTNQINNTISEIKSIKPEKTGKVLVGKAVFPASRKEVASFKTKSFNTKSLSVSNFKTKGFKIKAVPSDISSVSTISVIIPSDSATTPNKTIATGITDTLGNFQIDMGAITLANNSIYVLEASKRTGKDIETIRTFIKWNGTAWESITTGDTLINETTTSVSIIAGLTNISSINLISKIDPANVSDIKDSTNTTVLITKADITKVAGLINSVLLGERDPIALIKYDVTKPYKFFVDQTYNFANITLENGCTGCSFIGANFSTSGANLSGKDLSYADLSGQDLSNVDLSGTILIGADLTGANLPADMSYLNLESAILKNQDFTLKNLTDTNFHNADLTGAILSTSAIPKDLSKTRLSGANLTNAELSSGDFTKSYLFETVFDNNIIKNAKFEKADLTGANFSTVQGSDFSGVSFTNSILIGSNFSAVNLTNVDLITAKVQGSDFSKSTITSKKINDNLQNCNFSDSIIDGGSIDLTTPTAFFLNADLTGSDFSRTQLKNINFENIIAKDCNFSETNFNRVNFNNSNLESSLFDKTVFASNMNIKNTIMRKSSFNLITSTFNVLIDSPDISYASIKDSTITNFSFYTKKADYFNVLNSQFRIFKQKIDFNLFDIVKNVSNTITIPKYSVPDLTLLLLSDLKAETTDVVFTPSFTVLQYPPDLNMRNDFEMISYNGLTEFNDLYSDPNNTTLDLPPPEYAIKGLSFTNTTSSIFGYFYKSKFINVITASFTNYCNECTIDSPNNSFSISGAFLNSTINANSLTVQNTYLKKSTVSAITGSILNSYLNQTNYSFTNESGTNFFTLDSQNSATCSNETVVNVPHDYYFYQSFFGGCLSSSNHIITSTAKYKTYSKCFKNFNPSTFFLKIFPKKSLPVSSNPLCNADANFFSNNRIKYK